MDALQLTFKRLRRARRTALIPFVMAGDPDLRTTEALVPALADAGADLIEIGLPFSDPLADGPVIQRASSRALKAGATPARVLELLGRVSRRVTTPLVLLTYWNPIAQYGGTSGSGAPFLRAAKAAGVAGLIVPDLPLEEGERFRRLATQVGIADILLASPTTSPVRLARIAHAARGFIYYVSVTGTTGVRRQLPADLLTGVRRLKRLTKTPVCVGFGISTPAQARQVAQAADGVIVGSALIHTMEPWQRQPVRAIKAAAQFVRQLRWALG
ncbi:MAG: tryptophan synthase subunit alpha [Candidatus Omnitrophica bacterium]|nr:tryptophan synthase subunit alpha [Candidatus Omnitrophota bacterium]